MLAFFNLFGGSQKVFWFCFLSPNNLAYFMWIFLYVYAIPSRLKRNRTIVELFFWFSTVFEISVGESIFHLLKLCFDEMWYFVFYFFFIRWINKRFNFQFIFFLFDFQIPKWFANDNKLPLEIRISMFFSSTKKIVWNYQMLMIKLCLAYLHWCI